VLGWVRTVCEYRGVDAEARTGVNRDEQMMTVRGMGTDGHNMGNFRGDENIFLIKQ
jgi:hypothetical protein